MKSYDFDVIVIGGGAAGLTASKLARGLGKRVVLIEKNRLGGECTWTGCIPSKTLIRSATIAHSIQTASLYGLQVNKDFSYSTHNVLSHVQHVVQTVSETHTDKVLKELGIEVIYGHPFFVDDHTIDINGKKLLGKKFIIATGSRPSIPLIPGLDFISYETNETFFSRTSLPRSVLFFGGGAIAVELASALNRLGVLVVIIEKNKHILIKEDQELVDDITKKMINEDVSIFTGAQIQSVEQKESKVLATIQLDTGQTRQISAETVFVAVGRKPNIEHMNLENIGIAVHDKGLVISDLLQTSQNHIFACGDVVGPYLFSHMAFWQALIAVKNAVLPFSQKVDYSGVCWVTFTSPELAHRGLTETEARERYGNSIKVEHYRYDQLDRSYTDSELDGVGKFICDKSGRLIGAHILGARAGELIHEVQIGEYNKMLFKNYYHIIHAYPTYSELIWHASQVHYINTLKNTWAVKIIQTIRFLWNAIVNRLYRKK